MNHDVIVAEIQARAARRGILSHYCGRALTCQGDRGLPDLLLVGPFGSCFIEVKTAGDKLSAEQITWKHALKAAGQVYYVVGAECLADSSLHGILDWMELGAKIA